MLKKSLVICVCLESLIVSARVQPVDSLKNTELRIAKNAEQTQIKNISEKQKVEEYADQLRIEINAHIESKEIKNAQQMYDFLTRIKAFQNDPKLLDLLNILCSFLRRQDNSHPINELMKDIDELLNAWVLLVQLQSSNSMSFYNKMTIVSTLMNPKIFIHLNKQLMEFLTKFAGKMETATDISSITDDSSPEDGTVLTSVFFEEYLKFAKNVLNALNNLENQLKEFNNNIKGASKEELTNKIQQLSDLLNHLKQMEITASDKKILLSKNMVRHLRNIGGGVMSQLQEHLLKLL